MSNDKPLKLREWRLGGAAFGTHDPAPAKPCPGAYRYAVVRVKRNPDRATRALSDLGVKDQHGIYLIAKLTKRQTQVAFLHFDRRLSAREIAEILGCEALTVDVHLHDIRTRLQRLAA